MSNRSIFKNQKNQLQAERESSANLWQASTTPKVVTRQRHKAAGLSRYPFPEIWGMGIFVTKFCEDRGNVWPQLWSGKQRKAAGGTSILSFPGFAKPAYGWTAPTPASRT